MAPSGVVSASAWREYLELAAREGSGRSLVAQLLEEARIAFRAQGAALYLRDELGFHRELTAGQGAFPGRFGEDGRPGQEHLSLAGGEAIFNNLEAGEPPVDSGIVLAFAAAVRAYVLERKLKRQRFEVNYRGVELDALYDVGLAIASTLNLEELSEEILLRAVSLLDARRGALYSASDGHYSLSRTFGGEARQEVACDDPQVVELLAATATSAQDLMPGAEHLMAVPIEVESKPRGLLLMGDKESRHGVGPFGTADRKTLALFANQAAIALENAYLHRQALEKERLERDAELAADIQRRLLPAQIPCFDGLELAGWSRPARQVGGDYFDLLRLASGNLGAVVADVSGKGVPAALMVSTLYSALHLLVDRTALGPELVEALNHHVFLSSAPNKFITLVAAEIDPASGELRYVNAGHNPALLVRSSGGVEELAASGPPLGLFARGGYASATVHLAPGDLVCFFSDGITEAEAPDDEEFGDGRLIDLLRSIARSPLDEIVQAVDGATSRFAQGMPQGDDQTLVLVRKA